MRDVMKRTIILIVLAIMVPMCLLADSFRFSILWAHVNAAETSLSIVNLDNDDEVAEQTKELDLVTSIQDVARVKYVSNEGGIHVLSYRATPFANNSDPNGYAYNLFFSYVEDDEEDLQEIRVGTDKSAEYPSGIVTAETSINMGRGGSLNSKYVLIRAELPESSLGIMRTGLTYSSTVTVERTSP